LDVSLRVITDSTAALIAAAAQVLLFRSVAERSREPWQQRFEAAPWVTIPVILAGAGLGFAPSLMHAAALHWVRAAAVILAMVTTAVCVLEYGTRYLIAATPVNEGRREVLRKGANLLMAAPVAVTGYGVYLAARQVGAREVKLEIAGLPKELDGFRISQITDVHLSPYLHVRQLARAVGMANEWRPNLTVLTGDYISFANDPLEQCLDALASLRADLGVYGCLGNHEIVARSESATTKGAALRGITMLRNDRIQLRSAGTELNLVGVDYEPKGTAYLKRVAGLSRPKAFNILLSHNPDVFPRAVQLGFDLTLSGHTHGGQVTVEYLSQHLNVAKFYTPYVDGAYGIDGKGLYVSRGLGTIGVPVRLGVPPEVSLIRLCAT
jgi:predicted MPP superfamily phosphohydrolase